MADGLIVRVTTDIVTAGTGPGGMAGFALYGVACPTASEAIDAVRAVLPANWRVKGAIGPMSAETVTRLGLQPGEARRL